MTDTNTGTSGGTSGAAPPPPEMDRGTPSNYVRTRVQQMQQPPAGEQPAPDAGQQPPRQEQQQPPAEPAKIKVGDGEYLESDVQAAIAAKAEADIRKSGQPTTPEGYEVKTTAGFQLPEGVASFQFDMKDPTLAAARKFAMDRGLDQETFSGMLDLFVASKSGELLGQARAREANLQALGAAGPQRIDAVATWLKARAGDDGVLVGNFLKAYPSAPIVRAMETILKRFSSQGIAYSPQHRETVDDNAGKLPGDYSKKSFTEIRVAQMAQMLSRPGYRGGGGRRGE
jgi:hypothetical protein